MQRRIDPPGGWAVNFSAHKDTKLFKKGTTKLKMFILGVDIYLRTKYVQLLNSSSRSEYSRSDILATAVVAKIAAQPLVSRLFRVRVGVGVRARVRGWVGSTAVHLYLDPIQEVVDALLPSEQNM